MIKDARKVKIVVMDYHFLYLPLFYAQHKAFFGYIPENYQIEITRSAEHTDVATFEMLMDTSSAKNARVDFAVADPSAILSRPTFADPAPAILAALISNTAFWAVDRKSHTIITPQDLATFQNIIAFHPGTTSYAIAQRIFKSANKTPSIKSVHPQQELVALQDSKNTVALSPDILGIDALIFEKHQYNIDLALGTTQEFQNVFMTALLSRQDVVEEHRDLVVGLIKALQWSLMLVKAQAPDLLAYAETRFGEPQERIKNALHLAAKSQVFPLTVEVSSVTWMNAAQIYYDSTPAGYGLDQQKNARHLFQHVVQPYLALSRSAVNELYSQFSAPSKTESLWLRALRLSLVVLLCLGAGLILQQWSDWKAVVVFVVCTLLAIVLEMWLKLRRASLTWYSHWFFCGAFQVILVAWLSPEIRAHIPLGTYLPPTAALALFIAELRLVHEEHKKLSGGGK